MTRRYFSLTEAAEYLAISPRTMRRLISDGEIKGYRVGRGRLIRIDLDEIDDKLMNPSAPTGTTIRRGRASAIVSPCQIGRPR